MPLPYKTKNEDYVFFRNLKKFCEINKISLQVLGATNLLEEKSVWQKSCL